MMMRRASSSSRGEVASTSAASKPATCPPTSRPSPNAVPMIASAANRNRQPLAPFGDAEEVIRRRNVPVRKHRLVHPQLEIEAGRHVIAGLDHLARRLRVERLVRVPDRRHAEIQEIRDDGRRAAARQAACVSSVAASSGSRYHDKLGIGDWGLGMRNGEVVKRDAGGRREIQ